ncbi:hypothetical protein COBT_003616, partial [Conglomerata obtusa]
MTKLDSLISQLRTKKSQKDNFDEKQKHADIKLSVRTTLILKPQNNLNIIPVKQNKQTESVLQNKHDERNILKNCTDTIFNDQCRQHEINNGTRLHDNSFRSNKYKNNNFENENLSQASDKDTQVCKNNPICLNSYYNSSEIEINTKIINTQDISVKNDFNKLKYYKNNKNNLAEILKLQDLQFSIKLFLLIFKVSVDEFEMVTLTLSDESGSVKGCMPFVLYKNLDIKMGDVIEIQKFSLWRNNEIFIIL